MKKMKINEEFHSFCMKMYRANCKEREAYGEKPLTFLEYTGKNMDFIKKKYEKRNR